MRNKLTFFLAITLLALMVLHLPQPVLAERERDEIVVAASPHGWPPYVIQSGTDSPPSGIMYDVLHVAAEESEFSIRFVQYPEKRILMYMKEGTIDAYPKAREWVDDPDQFIWSEPIVISTDTLVFRKDSKIPEDITGLDVGVVLGFKYPTLEPHFMSGAIRRHEAKSTCCVLKMLAHGHVDTIITNKLVAERVISETPCLKMEDYQFAPTPIAEAQYRFAFTRKKNCNRFIKRFNKVIKAMHDDGRLAAIVARYR